MPDHTPHDHAQTIAAEIATLANHIATNTTDPHGWHATAKRIAIAAIDLYAATKDTTTPAPPRTP